jgi:hypothetical protein
MEIDPFPPRNKALGLTTLSQFLLVVLHKDVEVLSTDQSADYST